MNAPHSQNPRHINGYASDFGCLGAFKSDPRVYAPKRQVILAWALWCLVCLAEPQDHEFVKRPGGAVKDNGESACPVEPMDLAKFASREGPFETLPTYLTLPACTENSYHVGLIALPDVKFESKGPYRFLGESARALETSRFEKAGLIESRLLKRLPSVFREFPLTGEDIHLVGQLAVISPKLGRKALGNVIQTELVNGENEANLAPKLMRLGADRDLISLEIAEAAKELTQNAEGESLGRFLASLARAASEEGGLVSTFNRSASSVESAATVSVSVYTLPDRLRLGGSFFKGIERAVLGRADLEPGATSLGEAFDKVVPMAGVAKEDVSRAVRVLSVTAEQPALARSTALSLPKDAVFWKGIERERLLEAARRNPEMAFAVQRIYLTVHNDLWKSASSGKVGAYNQRKRALARLAESILSFPPEFVHPDFVYSTIRMGIITDAQIESRVPKMALERLVPPSDGDGTAQDILMNVTRLFAMDLALHQTFIPALQGWIERQSQR